MCSAACVGRLLFVVTIPSPHESDVKPNCIDCVVAVTTCACSNGSVTVGITLLTWHASTASSFMATLSGEARITPDIDAQRLGVRHWAFDMPLHRACFVIPLVNMRHLTAFHNSFDCTDL